MRAVLIIPLLWAATPAGAEQDAVFPEAYPASRYEQIMAKSPFSIATKPAAAPEPPKDSFTKEWVLAGLTRDKDSQGVERDFVAIRSRDQTQSFSLYGSEPNSEGVSIASVERSPQLGKSKVTLKKGSEFGIVEFNQMEVEASIPTPDGGASRPAMNANPPIPGAPRTPGQFPGGRPQIPRPGGAQPIQQQPPRPPIPQMNGASGVQLPGGTSAAAPNPNGDGRRRIRVIGKP